MKNVILLSFIIIVAALMTACVPRLDKTSYSGDPILSSSNDSSAVYSSTSTHHIDQAGK